MDIGLLDKLKLFDSYAAMHSFDAGGICNWNGALSQALN